MKAMETDGATRPSIYSYRLRRVIVQQGLLLACATMFGSIGGFIIYLAVADPSAIEGNPLYLEIVFILTASGFVWALLIARRRMQSIWVGSEAIGVQSCFGRVGRKIEWKEVRKIIKIRGFDFFLSRDRFFFEILSDNSALYFDDLIQNEDELLEAINKQIRFHGIEAVYVDKSSETLAEIRRSVSDFAVRRELLRNGRVSKIAAL